MTTAVHASQREPWRRGGARSVVSRSSNATVGPQNFRCRCTRYSNSALSNVTLVSIGT